MKNEKVENPKQPNALMLMQLGFIIGQETIKKLIENQEDLNFDQIQMMISDPENSRDLRDLTLKNAEEIFKIKFDPWKPQKQKISLFYRECFNLEIDWSGITIPKGPSDFKRLELIIQSLTEDQIFEAYAKRFGEDKVSKVYESISKSIKRDKGGEPLRPKTDYPLLHIGGDEPDKKHLNKSYNDFDGDGNKYMIVKEGMIAAFRYRFETGKMYDVNGLTRFHSLVSDGNAFCMCGHRDGRWCIDWLNRDYRFSEYGPRSVSF